MLSANVVACIFLLLTGCATAPASICPPVIPYTRAEQSQAADELEALPPKPMLSRFIADYATTRDRLRTCQ